MTETAINIAMWVMGGLLTLIFFLFTYFFTRSIKVQDDLTVSVNKLQVTLTGLNGIILSVQEKNDLLQGSCKERHETVDTRLTDHSKRLNDHENKLIKLETLQGVER